jgi:hypothetical protein
MRTSMVRTFERWKMEATSLMSDYMEIINPQTMIAKLLYNGEVVEEYKVDQCDKCSILTRFDAFGYQKGYGNEKIIWFCVGCR